MFGTVMCQLMKCVESRALVELSMRLAPVSAAPANVIMALARNDLIEISGPVLDKSVLLTDDDLAEISETKSQAHLSRIAGRPHVGAIVTNVLVDRGNSDVVNKLARNDGAQFSEVGMSMLVMRASSDDRLTESIAARIDVSPRMFRQLLAQATDAVRENLLAAAHPNHRVVLAKILDEISTQVGKRTFSSGDYAKARRVVQAFGHDTQRVKSVVVEFANANLLPEMVAALSLLSNVPINQVDRFFTAPSCFGIMALCKVAGLNWMITRTVILSRPGELTDPSFKEDEVCQQFNDLSLASAQRLVKGWNELEPSSAPRHDLSSTAVQVILDSADELQQSDAPLNMPINNIHYLD